MLERLSQKNYKNVLAIKIAPKNRDFISTMSETLIQASYTHGWEGYVYTIQNPHNPHNPKIVVGFCSIAPYSFNGITGWKICKLAIDMNHMGKGYGKKLFREILNELDNVKKINTISLSVKRNNEVAIALYESSGFKVENGGAGGAGTKNDIIYMIRTKQ